MKNLILLFGLLGSTFLSVQCSSKKNIILIDHGRPRCQIVLPENPSTFDQQTAGILREYLKRISGATVPVSVRHHLSQDGSAKIFIGGSGTGRTTTAALKTDGFVIETDDQNLYLYGNSSKATRYSVYFFLEKYLHCSKPAGNEKAITPLAKHLEVAAGIHDVQNPAFLFRQSFYPASSDQEYLDWHRLQHFDDWGLWGHSFFKIIPPDRYFRQHPEYFALVNGRRTPTQLCLSNPEVFQLTVEYLKNAIQNHPDARYWSISQMDNGGYCTCPACRAADRAEGGPQGAIIRFVNKVAARFPDKTFVTLAYAYSAAPPRQTRPAENVYILLSSIDIARSQSMAESDRAHAFRNRLKSWHKITNRIFIWDYTTQFTNYLCPFPSYSHVFADASFLLQHGVKGIFFQGGGTDFADMAAMNSYLQAQALWHPGQPADSVREKFFHAFFGPAAGAISDYVQALIHAVAVTNTTLRIYGNPINNRTDYLSPKWIDRYSRYLDTAEALTENHPVYHRHVARLRLGLEYVVLQQALAYGTEKHGYLTYNAATGNFEVGAKWRHRVERFFTAARQAGIRTLGETGPELARYYRHWQEIIARGWIKNPAADAQLSLAFPYSADYPANGIHTLVDGLWGSRDYSYNWLLFYGQDLSLTTVFSTARPVSSVTVGCLYDPRHQIYLPKSIGVAVSDDGENYRTIAHKRVLEHPASADPKRMSVTIPLDIQAHYYRVKAVCPDTITDGSLPQHKKPAIAIDEVRLQ